MTAFLPPNLLALFAPRDPLPFMAVPERPGHCRKHPYTGVSSLLYNFEDPKDTPPPTRVETKDERKERKNKERAEQVAYKLEQDLALWDPQSDELATTDPFKTLFVARINFDTSESKLRREFEVYGPIRHIRMISHNDNGKPRGYAFIEYEHERDMHSSYKHADGKKIDGRRVLVDVERARTVKGWRPRRLGGGLGSTRKGGAEVNSRFSGRDDNRADSRDRSQERGRGGGGARRSRSRDRERRRSRERGERKRRSRSRDRGGRARDEDAGARKRRSRSRDRAKRSKSRDRKRRRSRSKSGDRGSARGGDGDGEVFGQAFGNGQSNPPPNVRSNEEDPGDYGDY